MAVKCLLGCHVVTEALVDELERSKSDVKEARLCAVRASSDALKSLLDAKCEIDRLAQEKAELTALNGLLSARLASMKPRRPWWRILWRNNPDG